MIHDQCVSGGGVLSRGGRDSRFCALSTHLGRRGKSFDYLGEVATVSISRSAFSDSTPDMALERFMHAQEEAYAQVVAELQSGRKTGCWIWWIFPQEPRPGTSATSMKYALDEHEARDYLRHPLLGSRYRECLDLVHSHLCGGRVEPLTLMGGETDVLKLASSLDLFIRVSPQDDEVFRVKAGEVLSCLRPSR